MMTSSHDHWRQTGRGVTAGAVPVGEAGFALAGVLFVLVLLTLISVAALRTTGDEQMAGRAVRESVHAFYAANAGLAAELAGWDQTALDTLLAAPGDSVDLGWKTLENGTSYRAVVRRVGESLYSINVTSRGAGPNSGQRQIRLHLKSSEATIVTAALRGGALGDSIELDIGNNGNDIVTGIDTHPSQWSGVCPGPTVDLPGIVWYDTTSVLANSGEVLGAPPMVQDTTINNANLFDWGGVNYDDLVAMADITLTGGTEINETIKGFTNNNDCDYKWNNWGETQDSDSPCFDYFPIIHAQGDLTIKDNGNSSVGQGILLVDDDLTIEREIDFRGLIVAQGKVRFESSTHIRGALIAGNDVYMQDDASVKYSSCAIKRAFAALGLSGGIRPLGTRAWEQATN